MNTRYATIKTDLVDPELEPVKSVPTKLYTLIVPEKPPILAEERIFVYVPKVTIEHAGIAKFSSEHFNIVEGEVSLKESYLSEWLATNLLNPDLILVVTELPLEGSGNKIYVVPISGTTSNGYIWNSLLRSWVSLGPVALNLSDYYTKSEVQALLNNIATHLKLFIFEDIETAEAANLPDNSYAFIKT